jgi:hypothetical protein
MNLKKGKNAEDHGARDQLYLEIFYSCSQHQIACFNTTEGLHPPSRTVVGQQYSAASFAALS